MSLQSEEQRTTLINAILFAQSQEEVKHMIDITFKEWQQKEVSGELVTHFVNKIIGHLELFSPMKKEAQQWSNVKMAGILFNRIKNQLTVPFN